jgi:hypothetical protein
LRAGAASAFCGFQDAIVVGVIMSGQNIKVARFELTLADFWAMQAYLCRPVKRYPWYLPLSIGVAFGVGSILAFEAGVSPPSFLLGLIGALVLFATFTFYASARARSLLQPLPNAGILCSYEYTFDEQGVTTRTPGWETLTRWSGVIAIEETPRHVFLKIDKAAAYTIPKRAFSSPEHLTELREYARARVGTAPRPVEDAAAPPVTSSVQPTHFKL